MTTPTETQKIDDFSVLGALRSIVEDMGRDYVYEKVDDMCVYTNDDGSPSCLVGHVLARIAPDAQLSEGSVLFYDNRERLLNRGFSDRALGVLQIAQFMQDRGHTWGVALDAAAAAYDAHVEPVGE